MHARGRLNRWSGVATWAALLACVRPSVLPGPAWVSYPDVEVAHVRDVHSYRGGPVCQACHQRGRVELLNGPTRTCERCHQVRHTAAHESGTQLPPSRVGGLPLPGGRVVCHTCHDPHDVRRHRHGLRLPVDALCKSCHPGY